MQTTSQSNKHGLYVLNHLFHLVLIPFLPLSHITLACTPYFTYHLPFLCLDWFPFHFLLDRFHLYVIGTEECERSIARSAIITSKKKWEKYLKAALGPSYVPLKSQTLQAIHMIVFAHIAIAPLCTDLTSAAIATGKLIWWSSPFIFSYYNPSHTHSLTHSTN